MLHTNIYMINFSCLAGCSGLEIFMSLQFYGLKCSVVQNGMFHICPPLRGIGGVVAVMHEMKFEWPKS